MATDKARILDYATQGEFLEFPIEHVRQRIYETIKRYQDQRDLFLDMVSSTIAEDSEPAILAATLLMSQAAGIQLEGKLSVVQDNAKKAAALEQQAQRLLLFANNYSQLSQGQFWIRVSLEQAKELNL